MCIFGCQREALRRARRRLRTERRCCGRARVFRSAIDDLIAVVANRRMLCLNVAEPSWDNARG
jgi:hypothetical protein